MTFLACKNEFSDQMQQSMNTYSTKMSIRLKKRFLLTRTVKKPFLRDAETQLSDSRRCFEELWDSNSAKNLKRINKYRRVVYRIEHMCRGARPETRKSVGSGDKTDLPLPRGW